MRFQLTDRDARILRLSEISGHQAKLGTTPHGEITLTGNVAQLSMFLLQVGEHDLAIATLLAERVEQPVHKGSFVFRTAYWPEPVTESYIDSFGKLRSPDNKRAAEVYPIAGSDPQLWRIRVIVTPETPGWVGGQVLFGHDQATKEAAMVIARVWTDHGKLPDNYRPYAPYAR